MKLLRELLPDTLSYDVLENLPPDSIYVFSRVCKDALDMVHEYIRRRFSILILLSRYFDWNDAIAFRALMASTGMLISGSTALQFFDRTMYTESDLDLYLENIMVTKVSDWLTSVGYRYTPHDEDTALSLSEMVARRTNYKPAIGDAIIPMVSHSYLGCSMVLDFVNDEKKRKIQLVTADVCPVQLIIGFHSTAVLNVLSHSKAYSLHPTPTYVQRVSYLQNAISNDAHQLSLLKYKERGWEMAVTPPEERLSPRSSLMSGERHFGDSKCWTISLFPPVAEIGKDVIEINRWLVTVDESHMRMVEASIFTSDRLRHAYTVSPSLSSSEILRRFDAIKSENSSHQFLDSEFHRLWDA